MSPIQIVDALCTTQTKCFINLAEKLMSELSFTTIYFYRIAKYDIIWVINWIIACYSFVKNHSVPISIAYLWKSYIFHDLLIKMENFVLLEPLRCKFCSYFLTDITGCVRVSRDFNFSLECQHVLKASLLIQILYLRCHDSGYHFTFSRVPKLYINFSYDWKWSTNRQMEVVHYSGMLESIFS